MTWSKLESGIRSNGKVAEAGPDGALLFLSLLTLHADKGRGGVVPESCCRPARLRCEAVAFLGSFDVERIDAAIDACVRAELVARRADGALVLRGWSDAHAVRCSHCKGPNPEPSYATCPTCREARNAERKSGRGNGAQHGSAQERAGARRRKPARAQSAQVSLDRTSTSTTPQPPAQTRAGGDRAAARGASAERAENQKGASNEGAKVDMAGDRDPVVLLQDALLASPYRSELPPMPRRFHLAKKAEQLHADGLDVARLRRLVSLDKSKARTEGALLATWIDEGGWRDVEAEQAEKRDHAAARARGAAAAAGDDLLDGIYGSPPKSAASVGADVVARAAREVTA